MKQKKTSRKLLGFWSIVAIGIGGMVGGGIFAVLGLAVQIAHGGTPIAFLVAGIIALVTSYSYTKLSVRYPSEGGTVTFLVKAFGSGLFSGSLNVLLWISYIVMLSLYAYAFGSYGATFFPASTQELWKHVLISGILVLMLLLNFLSANIVGKAEQWIVWFKLTILIFFVGAGLSLVHVSRLAPATWSSPLSLIVGGMIIFVAYEGFELIANTAHNARNPKKTLPRAYYSSVLFVILLYILVAIVAIGNLPINQILGARDYALAEAAKPFLGQNGFILITIAALLSTASAINATLFGAARVSYTIAKNGEMPKALEKRLWHKHIDGMIITAAITLLVANFLPLASISTAGSAGFLLIFAVVNMSAIKLAKETSGNRWISGIGAVLCMTALIALLWYAEAHTLTQFLSAIGLFIFAFLIEWIYRFRRKYNLLPPIKS